MNIILVGYGKMGKTIERIALDRGHTITGKIDVQNQSDLLQVAGDVAIEFSHPDAAFNNIKTCIERGIPVVSGTTGWLEKRGLIEDLVHQHGGTFFYASNFSLGVNIFFKLNEHLAKMMSGFSGYEVSMEETHHTEKKDAPSGTAITLAEGIIKNYGSIQKWVEGERGKVGELPILSHRIGQVPGTHQVRYQSPVDTIEIVHTAHTREGFAAGAVQVAEWIPGKKGVLNMDDFLKF